jgi:adenylate cyclase
MKRCPKCDRSYEDETLNFCLEDGEWLLDDQAGEPATAIISESPSLRSADLSSESATKAQITTTDQTAILPAVSLPDLQARQTSSAEYIVNEVKSHRRGFTIAAVVVVIAVAGISYWLFRTHAMSDAAPISSIAVLPFQNKNSDTDTDYLSDGLAESLVFRLSQLPNLKVSPTSSVIRYKGKDNDISKIAAELGVDAVMSGRMVQRGDGLMISVELVDARNNKLLWGEQYDRKMSDLLATQREIAATIVQKLQLKLVGSENKGITKKYTDNNDAYQLYLKGRFYFARRTDADIRQSIELFQQAIKLDPNFALAYVGIGESWAVMPSYPYMEAKDAMPLAKTAIAKALEIDPELPEAHTVAGIIAATYDWDWTKAESEFKRSLELDPNLAITHYRYAWVYLSPMGRHEEAITEMSRAMELEPLSLVQGANFAAVYIYARQNDKALEQAKKTYDMDPTLVTGQNWMCHSLDVNGRYPESLAISEKSFRTNGSLYAALSYAYARSGRRQDAETILKQWNEVKTTKSVSHYWQAITYAALGDKDTAFADLEKAYQDHDWFYQRIKVDPFLDPLRDDPRFDDLVKRLGLPR